MNRRRFLIRAAQASLAGLAAAFPFHVPASAQEILPSAQSPASIIRPQYRGTPTGEIWKSEDNGRTWQIKTRLGKQVAVSQVSVQPGQVIAHVKVQGQEFDLKSTNDRVWYTAGWKPPISLSKTAR